VRRLLLGGALAALGWAAVVSITGGITLRAIGLTIRSRGALRPFLAGLALLAIYGILERRAVRQAVARPVSTLSALAPWIVAALALITTIDAIRYGAFTASGSDSYGYLSEAYGWARGELPRAYPIPLSLPLANSDWLQTPIGYWTGRLRHTIVPSYAPGLPLLMAIGILVADPIGPYLVVPLSAGLFVWATYAFATRMSGRLAGLAAALLAATSPVVLFLSIWVMSDVPAGAAFTAAAAAIVRGTRRSAAAAGVFTAIGVLIRPNLVPLAALLFLWLVVVNRRGEWLRRAALFGVFVAAAALFIGALNAYWYGSPLLSGYGNTSERFGLRFLSTNLRLYPAWLVETQSFGILVSFVTLAALVRRGPARASIALAWGISLGTLLCYITYTAYDAWWYLRFLLPGLGAFFALVAAGLAILANRIRRPWGALAAIALLVWLIAHPVRYAAALDMFGPFQKGEHRYADFGAFIVAQLPPDAVFFAMQHGGSIRYYAGRHTLRYDMLDGTRAPRAIAAVEALGLHPFLAIEDGELDLVRSSFGLPPGAALPWPHVARMQAYGGLSIYDLASYPTSIGPVPIDPGQAPPYSPPRPIVIAPRPR
jgi:hypothetical protein